MSLHPSESGLTNTNRLNQQEARIDLAAKAMERPVHQAGLQMQPPQPPFREAQKVPTTYLVANNQKIANTTLDSMEASMVDKSLLVTMARPAAMAIKSF